MGVVAETRQIRSRGQQKLEEHWSPNKQRERFGSLGEGTESCVHDPSPEGAATVVVVVQVLLVVVVVVVAAAVVVVVVGVEPVPPPAAVVVVVGVVDPPELPPDEEDPGTHTAPAQPVVMSAASTVY